MRTFMAALVCLAGCGRYGFADRIDGSTDDAAALADAEPDAVEVRCGSREVLADGFDDATAGPFFTASPTGRVTIVQIDSAVEFQLTDTASGEYASYASVTIGAGDTCVVVEVLEVPDQAMDGVAYLKLVGALGEVEFVEHGGAMEARYRAGGTLHNQAQFPWDAVAMRFWRIARIGTGTLWQTSADGVGYVNRLYEPNISVDGTFRADFGAGASIALVGNAGKTRFGSALVLQN